MDNAVDDADTGGCTLSAARSHAGFDSALLALLPAALIAAVGVGFVSGDALALASLEPEWQLNPNHLLLEPLSAVWIWAHDFAGSRTAAVDALARLSVVAGALSLALFRYLVAPTITASRATANAGTIVFALISGFDRLWISGEAHMIQIPFLVLHLAGALSLLRNEELSHRAMVYTVIGGTGAVLAYVTNALVVAGLTTGLVLMAGTRGRRVLSASLAMTSVACVPIFLSAWYPVHEQTSFIAWLTSYAGGQATSREAASYGVEWTLTGLLVAVARGVFGLFSTIVDLAPLTDLIRRGYGSVGIATLHALACLTAVILTALVWAKRRAAANARLALQCLAGVAIPVLLFGILWNNSDDQFYFQIAPVLSLVALAGLEMAPSRLALALLLLPVLVNLRDLVANYLTYPREDRVAALAAALDDVSLIVAPGRDEVAQLLHFTSNLRERVILISSLAESSAPAEGLAVLNDTVQAVLSRGGRVAAVNILPMADAWQPWPQLRKLNYGRKAIYGAFGERRIDRTIVVAPAIIVEVYSHE